MAEYKAVRITGGAVADLSGGKRTRKRKVKGDPDESPSMLSMPNPSMSKPSIPLESFKNATITKVGTTAGGAAALMPVPPSTAPFPLQAPALTSLRPQPMQPQPQQSQPMQPQQMQGGKQIRVELKKIQSKKVKLHPKREVAKLKPIKKTRKFVLGVSSLHKRMTRAKKMQRTLKEIPLDKLKEQLIKANLIKKTSKAPEAILRQIAEDSQLVGKHML
jgi:hypothetical protein